MKKLLVYGSIGLGVVIVLLVAAVIILPMVVPAETYRDRLIAEVKSTTGRDLRIDGPMHVSVIPRLAIEAEKISLSNAPGAQAKEMLTLGKLQAELQLFPLLQRTVVVDKFVLVDPVIAFEVDKQGHGNWMLTATPATPSASAAPPAAGGGSGTNALNALRLGDVRMENGTISYLDQRTGEHTVVDQITMDVSFPDFNSPLKVDGTLRYKGVPITLKMNAGKTSDFLTAAGTPVEMSVKSSLVDFDFKGKGSASVTSGTIDLKTPSLRKLSAWSGGALPAQGAGFGPFSVTGKLSFEGEVIKFTDADITMDAIKGKGDISIDASGAKRVIKGNLTLAALDLNPYLGPETSGAVGGSGAAASGWSDAPIDVSGLKAADVDFKFTANAIQFRKIHIDRASITAHDVNGKLELDLTDLAAYQGSGKATVTVDSSGAEPAIAASVNVTGVQMQPMLRDLMNVDRLTGRGNYENSLTAHGHSERAMISTLNGKGSLNVADGEITGLDLLKLLNTATSVVGSAASALTGGGSGTTKFSRLTMSYTITAGILHNNDLKLDSPGLQAEGAGTVDLPKRQIDYKVTPKVVGLSVPVDIRGPLDNPSYFPDLAGIVKGGVGGAIDTLKSVIPGQGGGGSGSKPSGGGGVGGAINNLFK